MINKIKNLVVNDQEIEVEWQKFLSLILLFIAGLMSFFSYTHIGKFWNTTLKFTPGFISAIAGIILIAPLYMRNILKWNRSIYTIFSFVLILLVFASFIELATGGNRNSTITYLLLAISVVLSWVGIRGVAGISWILLIAAAIYSAIINNVTMGFYGFIYVASGFLGLLMHAGLNPGAFLQSIKDEYSSVVNNAANRIKADIREVGDIAQKI